MTFSQFYGIILLENKKWSEIKLFKVEYTIRFYKTIVCKDGERYSVDGSWILKQLYRLQEQYSFKIIKTETRFADFCYICIKCKPKYINAITHSFAILAKDGIENVSFEKGVL